ncbi:MAG: VWA domain-containing protein [Victivallales bacterium]|nr:VWA domain-containing protein [Victivallales bacterium]
MIWQSLDMLYLLWALPLLFLIYIYAGHARRKAMDRFAASGMQERLLASVNPVRRRWKQFAVVVALAFLIIALARPSWNPVAREVTRRGRDVVFVLDVSRSMLADDLQPNRLERAKIAIGDCIDVLEGDRVALVVFAGTAIVRCPLTVDYGFFRMMLSDVECRSVGKGGTKIGDALRLVMNDVFDGQEKQFKDVVLITDGEDQDSFAKEAAEALGKASIRLIAIGLGDEANGTPIMVTNEDGTKDFIKHNGEIVRSRLDGATLREMVSKTPGGRYLPVVTGNFDLGAIYRSLIASAEKRLIESETIERYEEKFQIFLFVAVLILAAEPFVGIRRKRQ